MVIEQASSHEGLLADATSVWTFAQVSLSVDLEMSGMRERFVTELALKGFLPRMSPCMGFEITGVRERLAALLAPKGLLSRVCPQVTLEAACS